MAEPDRTNADAERVTDIVAELRANATAYAAVGVMDTSALLSKVASIIEAQSKALAEARELLEAIDAEVFLPPQLQELLQAALTPTPENPNG